MNLSNHQFQSCTNAAMLLVVIFLCLFFVFSTLTSQNSELDEVTHANLKGQTRSKVSRRTKYDVRSERHQKQ